MTLAFFISFVAFLTGTSIAIFASFMPYPKELTFKESLINFTILEIPTILFSGIIYSVLIGIPFYQIIK